MNESLTKELSVTIRTDESLLTLTPRGLLEFYLPHAEEFRPGVWKGKSSTGKDVYIQTEVLAGALLDCKEKQLNPITEIYLLPSNSPDRKAAHKVKYTVGLERMRDLPGFLGLNSGLVVERENKIERRNGRMPYPGDTVFGAWAKAYFQGLPEPLEHEVDLESCRIEHSPNWQERPGFMLLKVVEDELWRLKVLPRFKPKDREALESDAILLEARPVREVPKPPQASGQSSQAEKQDEQKSAFVAGELYTGQILNLTGPSHLDKKGKRTAKSLPGTVTITCQDGAQLSCIYWTFPAAIPDPAVWPSLLGAQAVMSFREKKNEQGTIFRFIDTLDISTGASEAAA